MFDKKWKKMYTSTVLETSQPGFPFHPTSGKDYKAPSARERLSYFKERTKQREYLDSQIAHLDKLLKDNSINEDTYVRFKKLLEMRYGEKRETTREKHGFTNHKT